jgi:hypothetical protein
MPSSFLVIKPLRPKRTIVDMATAKGGEMMGRMAMTLKSFLKGTSSLVCTKAKRKPSAVPMLATPNPIHRVLRITLQVPRAVINRSQAGAASGPRLTERIL